MAVCCRSALIRFQLDCRVQKWGNTLIQFGHWLTQERENKAKCLFPVVAKANAAFPLPLFELFSMSLEMHFSTLPCSQKPWLSYFPVEPVAILYEIILLKTPVRPSVTNMITVNLILLVHCLYILFHIDISLQSLRAWLLGCATYVCDKQALFVCCMFVQYLAVTLMISIQMLYSCKTPELVKRLARTPHIFLQTGIHFSLMGRSKATVCAEHENFQLSSCSCCILEQVMGHS